MNQFITWLSRAEELAASHPPLKADLIALKEEEIAHTVGDCEVTRSLVVGIGPVHTKTIVNANASKRIYLCPHEDHHRLRSVFTPQHENARKRIKRCHTPNVHTLSI